MSTAQQTRDETTDPATELTRLYFQAFREFGTMALWSMRPVENPTAEDALAITRALRTEGNMASRRLAEQIEKLARAAH